MLEQKVTVETMNIEEGTIYGLLNVNGKLHYYAADETLFRGVHFMVEEIIGGERYDTTIDNLTVESVQNAIDQYRSQLQ